MLYMLEDKKIERKIIQKHSMKKQDEAGKAAKQCSWKTLFKQEKSLICTTFVGIFNI